MRKILEPDNVLLRDMRIISSANSVIGTSTTRILPRPRMMMVARSRLLMPEDQQANVDSHAQGFNLKVGRSARISWKQKWHSVGSMIEVRLQLSSTCPSLPPSTFISTTRSLPPSSPLPLTPYLPTNLPTYIPTSLSIYLLPSLYLPTTTYLPTYLPQPTYL